MTVVSNHDDVSSLLEWPNAHEVSCGPVHARDHQPCYTNLVQLLPSCPASPTASPLRYAPWIHILSATTAAGARRARRVEASWVTSELPFRPRKGRDS